MGNIIKILKLKNIASGYLYFYIHLITEIICFYYLSVVTNNSNFVWLIPFIYDGLAFVPQGIFGYINDKYPKFNMGIVGTILLIISYILLFYLKFNLLFTLVILSIGNALLHVSGAENTLRVSGGKLSHSAIFVGGGSFGVALGKVLAMYNISPIILILLALTMIPFILLADTYMEEGKSAEEFDYVKSTFNPFVVIILATFVVIIRGYMGYGIPTSWNKTTIQMVLLFFTMGIGKCLGGILSDAYGIRKIGILSTLLAIPFLSFGDDAMLISLIGVMMFSMTMSITLACIVSVLKNSPGLAFGFTTIGLFLGTAPIFFISIPSKMVNILIILVFSIMCSIILGVLLKKENVHD